MRELSRNWRSAPTLGPALCGSASNLADPAAGYGAMKLAFSSPCYKQFRDPLRVFDIGLASWHRFDMLRIDHQQL